MATQDNQNAVAYLHDQFSILCCLIHAAPCAAPCTQGGGIGHLRAPDDLSNVVNAVGQLSQLLATRQACGNVTEACQVLAEDHGANQAVVTGRVGYALLVLNGPSG